MEQPFHDPGGQLRWGLRGDSGRVLGLGGLRRGRAGGGSGRDCPLCPADFAIVASLAGR